jgi:hypothetical protein
VVPDLAQDDTIRCLMRHTILKPDLEFWALSYTWGTDTTIRPIYLNGQIFYVRENLFNSWWRLGRMSCYCICDCGLIKYVLIKPSWRREIIRSLRWRIFIRWAREQWSGSVLCTTRKIEPWHPVSSSRNTGQDCGSYKRSSSHRTYS